MNPESYYEQTGKFHTFSDIVEKTLKTAGYIHFKHTLYNPSVYILERGSECYVVVTIDEICAKRYTYEEFIEISQNLRLQLKQETPSNTFHYLYIIISDDDDAPARLLHKQGTYWRITPSDHCMLMVYEDADYEFMKFRTALELNLESFSQKYTPDKVQTIFSDDDTHIFSPMNVIIIIINILIFLYTDSSPDIISSLVDKAALSWDRVFNSHEYYRMVTSMFLHSNIDHIFNNMLVLLFIGSYLEYAVGKLNYIIIYFSSGILAGCTSMVYNMMRNDNTCSIGASGAIFGIMGALVFIILIKYRNSNNIDLRKILFMAALSLYSGFTSQGVDNADHVGGFIGGFLVTALIYFILLKTFISSKNNKRK